MGMYNEGNRTVEGAIVARYGVELDGAELERRRLVADLDRYQLAEAVGRSYLSIWAYEKNERRPMPLGLYRLANALGCEVEDLLVTRDA